MMIDECMTFIVAATQTTSVMIANTLYYITRDLRVRKNVIDEVKKFITKDEDKLGETETWLKVLNSENLNDCSYL